MQNDEVEIKAVNLPTYKVSKDNWDEPIDDFRQRFGDANRPEILIMQSYNLCPIPFITELSIETWNLYNAIGGIGNVNSPKEYYALQTLYVDGVNIIQNEIANLKPYMKDN